MDLVDTNFEPIYDHSLVQGFIQGGADLDGLCIVASLTEDAVRALDGRDDYDADEDPEEWLEWGARVILHLIKEGAIRRSDFVYDESAHRWARADAPE